MTIALAKPQAPPKVHDLKTWPIVFDAVATRAKTFEIRKDDRGYQVGDILLLREWDPETEEYSGRKVRALVTYLLPGGRFGIQQGFVCMSIKRLP